MEDIYRQSKNEAAADVGKFIAGKLKEQQTFGFVKPYVPVVQPPLVRKVWVPDRRSVDDQGVLVGGHWVYLMVKEARWFINDEIKEPMPIVIPGKAGKDGGGHGD